MRFRDFMAAIFAGRFVRFMALGLLTLWFGPQVVGLAATLFRRHIFWVLGAVAVGLVVWLVLRVEDTESHRSEDQARVANEQSVRRKPYATLRSHLTKTWVI